MFELSLGVAVASAVMAGVFFAFSSFIMTALGNIEPAAGIRAMQRINIDVFCWSFSFLFFGLPLLSLGFGIYAVLNLSQPEAIYYLVGSFVYLVGSLLVTAKGNVPLNDALARVDPYAENAVEQWRKYLVTWTRWNHLRAVACLVAGVVFVGAGYVQWR